MLMTCVVQYFTQIANTRQIGRTGLFMGRASFRLRIINSTFLLVIRFNGFFKILGNGNGYFYLCRSRIYLLVNGGALCGQHGADERLDEPLLAEVGRAGLDEGAEEVDGGGEGGALQQRRSRQAQHLRQAGGRDDGEGVRPPPRHRRQQGQRQLRHVQVTVRQQRRELRQHRLEGLAGELGRVGANLEANRGS